MRTQFFRLPPRAQASFLIAVFLIVLIAILPNYEARAYRKTPPSDDWGGDIGYPAGDNTKILRSADEIAGEKYVYTLEADASAIRPLGVYRGIQSNSITKSGLLRAFQGYGNDPETTMGQYYSVELDDGETAIVFFDDAVVKLPRSGTVRLPRGQTKLLGQTSIDYISEKAGIPKKSLKYYVHMVGDWRNSSYAEKSMSGRIAATAVIFLTVFPGGYILFILLDKWMVKTGKAEEIEKKEAAKAAASPKPVKHKKRSAWYNIIEERMQDYKPTLQDKIEARIDKFSTAVMPGHDWKSDTRRSWDAFGGTLAFTGFMMAAIFIFLYFVSWKHPIPLHVVIVIAGCSLACGIVGLRIAAWDHPRPYMTKPDPDKDYIFSISSGDGQCTITDASQIDEAYRAFIEEHRAWQLTIDPPIGSLSCWSCFYDEKAGYVTEITLKYDTVTRRWRKSGKKPASSEIKCLKKIYTGHCRVRL